MVVKTFRLRPLAAAALVAALPLAAAGPARADDATIAATYKDIEQTLGGVPSFVKLFAKAALPGAWQETKALTFSDETALPPKVKALISLAVAAQFPALTASGRTRRTRSAPARRTRRSARPWRSPR